ncbi:MAG: AEC family transporter [Clostridiales bacterium]|jgi:predicted permease|nr:AEC family transporter [Clostridiales bacterium]
MVIFNSLQSVFSIILMVACGWFLYYKKIFDAAAAKLFPKVIIYVAVPSYILSSLPETYSKEKLIQLAPKVLIPYLSIVLSYAIGVALARALRLPRSRRGIFAVSLSVSNTLFVGLPVNLSVFGKDSVPFVFIYFIANVSLFWSLGAYSIAKDGAKPGEPVFSLQMLKNIFSPPLLSMILAVLLIICGMHLPGCINKTLVYLGNMTTPLSLLYIGVSICSMNLKDIKWDKSMTLLVIGRFILSPLFVFGLCTFIQIPLLMEKVFIIQSAMPTMAVTSAVAEIYGADYQYAAVLTTVTTIATLLFIPVYIVLLGVI